MQGMSRPTFCRYVYTPQALPCPFFVFCCAFLLCVSSSPPILDFEESALPSLVFKNSCVFDDDVEANEAAAGDAEENQSILTTFRDRVLRLGI